MERKATHKASEKSIVDIALDHGPQERKYAAHKISGWFPNDRSGLELAC
jgi:hypothetical protein